jgi:ABC-type sugar transport system permease subunit
VLLAFVWRGLPYFALCMTKGASNIMTLPRSIRLDLVGASMQLWHIYLMQSRP